MSRRESDELLLNVNNSSNGSSEKKSTVCFITVLSLIVLVAFSLAVISAILNGLIWHSISQPIVKPTPPIRDEKVLIQNFTAGGPISQGAPVGLCGNSLENNTICMIDKFGTFNPDFFRLPGPLNGTDPMVSLVSWVSDVSDYENHCLVQHVRNSATSQHSFNFYITALFSPILYYGIFSVDVLSQIERPLQAGESYKLLAVKLFSKQQEDKYVTTKFLLSYVRSTPSNGNSFVNHLKSVVVTFVKELSWDKEDMISLSVDAAHVVGPQITENGSASQEFSADKFTIAVANSGVSTATQTLFVLYYYSALSDKCKASVMSYNNNQLSLLNALQDGKSIGCKVGLTGFNYDANTILLFELKSVGAFTIDDKSGALTLKSFTQVYAHKFDGILSCANPGAIFIGNDYEKVKDRSTQFIAIYSNQDSFFTEISQIKYDGNMFHTFRSIPLGRPMPNIRATFFSGNTAQLTYEDGDMYRTVMVAFTSEVENDYSIATAIEGIHFSVGFLTPSAWSLISPSYCPDKTCTHMLQNPKGMDFNLILFETPTNAFGLIGVSTADAKVGDSVRVVTDGVTPVGTFKDGVKFIPGKNYYALDGAETSRLTVSVPFETQGLLVGRAITQNQILINLFQEGWH